MLAHLIEGDFITTLLLTNHCCKLFIHGDISVHKLSSEVILRLLTFQVSRDHFGHLFLFIELRRQGFGCCRWYFLNITHVTLSVSHILWLDIRSVWLLIVRFCDFQSLLYFSEFRQTSFFFIYVANKFLSWNKPDVLPSYGNYITSHLHLSPSR